MGHPAEAAPGGAFADDRSDFPIGEEAFFEEEPTVSGDMAAWGEELPDEVDERWCVDHGAGMEVMSAAAIRLALATGRLRPSQKIWRDGHACWQSISDFAELMPRDFAHERTGRFDVPERSGPRRIVRRPSPRDSQVCGPHSPPRRLSRSTAAFLSALFAGVLLGLLLFLPLTSSGLAPDLGAQARQLLAPLAP